MDSGGPIGPAGHCRQKKIIKSFCRGVQGGRFLQKESPLAAGGKKTIR